MPSDKKGRRKGIVQAKPAAPAAKPAQVQPDAAPDKQDKALLPARGYARGMTAYVHGDNRRSTGSEMWPNHYAVILTPADVMAYTHTAQVVYLTSSSSKIELAAKNPHLVLVHGHAGKDCAAVCNQVHTVDVSRLSHPTDRMDDATMRCIEDAVVDALGLSGSFQRKEQAKPAQRRNRKKGGTQDAS